MARVAASARGAFVVAVGVGTLMLSPTAAVQAQVTADTTLFSVNTGTALFTVNRLTGAATQVGTLAFATSALARNPNTGLLYYTSNAGTLGRVGTYNPANGATSVINAVGNGDLVVRLTFDANGVLYGIGNAPNSLLYMIDATTGAYTTLGPVRIGSSAGAALGGSGDMAFDFDGTLYLIANDLTSGGASLYRLSLSPVGGAYIATFISNAVPSGAQNSLAFVSDGRLVSGGVNQTMYVINKATGAATVIPGATAQYADFATSARFANLGITGTSTPVPIGATVTYSISVTNAGPQSANGQITVVDSLPANFTYLSATGTGWTCAAVGQRVTCTNPGPLANGASSALGIQASVGAAVTAGTSVPNIVRVAGSTNDQDQSNNRYSIPGTAVANIDFTLTKTHVGNFTVGVNGIYTLTAKNVGSSPSSGTVTLVDTLPAGLTWVSATGINWTCSHAIIGTGLDLVTCFRTIALAGNTTAPAITLTVAVAQAAAPSVTNTAQLSGGAMLAPQVASDPTTITFRAVAVTPDAAPVTQLPSHGTSYTGSFTVANTGTLADTYTLVASSAPGTTISITSVNGVAGTTTTLAVAVGANPTVPVVYTVANGALSGAVDTLKLVATSTSSATVTDLGSIVVTVIRAGLAMTKAMYRADQTTLVASTDQVAPGETVNYLVTVSATGGAGTTLVHITDALPAGVTFVSTTPDAAGWTISQSGGTVTADLAGTLAVGTSRFFWIRVKVL